jgi:type III pantothenate kinase
MPMEPSDLKLIIDSGNTRLKLHLFQGKSLLKTHLLDASDSLSARQFVSSNGPFKSAIISSVSLRIPPVIEFLKTICPVTILDHTTPIPIRNCYQTPGTLGPDRLAGAVGGYSLFPDNTVLVIDAGTCINYEFVDQGAYLGGLIAPGIGMQAAALNQFTGKLPLVDTAKNPEPH